MNLEEMARHQQAFARIGEAENRCTGCGVYRLDGRPPILHREDCEDRPDIGEMIAEDFSRRRLRQIRRLYGLDLSPYGQDP